MSYSSYQVQRVIDRLRRIGRWIGWPALPASHPADRVRTSRDGRIRAAERAAGQGAPATAPPRVADVRAREPRPPRVEAERERRAGSFLHPPYVPQPPPGSIPKLPSTLRRVRGARPLTDGD